MRGVVQFRIPLRIADSSKKVFEAGLIIETDQFGFEQCFDRITADEKLGYPEYL